MAGEGGAHASSAKDALDLALHAVGGFALYALPAFAAPGGGRVLLGLACLVSGAAGGVLRELAQHADDRPRLTLHRWIEGIAWGVGAAIAGALL